MYSSSWRLVTNYIARSYVFPQTTVICEDSPFKPLYQNTQPVPQFNRQTCLPNQRLYGIASATEGLVNIIPKSCYMTHLPTYSRVLLSIQMQ